MSDIVSTAVHWLGDHGKPFINSGCVGQLSVLHGSLSACTRESILQACAGDGLGSTTRVLVLTTDYSE